jgi:hypothetical protein
MRGAVLLVMFSVVAASGQSQKYPWQSGDTPCNETMTLCWYGVEDVSGPEVTAYGNQWVTQDKDERPLEWVTEVRCLQKMRVCILARNQKIGRGSHTNIDLYGVEEWSDYQIRTVGVGDAPRGSGKECEIDSLLLNRAEGSVSMLTVPGPGATTKVCMGVIKPKTVVYKLEIGPPKF